MLEVTTRQLRRLIQRVRAEGADATAVWAALGGLWADAGDGETSQAAVDLHPRHRRQLPGTGKQRLFRSPSRRHECRHEQRTERGMSDPRSPQQQATKTQSCRGTRRTTAADTLFHLPRPVAPHFATSVTASVTITRFLKGCTGRLLPSMSAVNFPICSAERWMGDFITIHFTPSEQGGVV